MAAVPVVDEGEVVASSRLAMNYHLALLELARYKLKSFPDYTCTFTKQERVDGQDLSDVQTMQLKLRHQPFSVYMKWEEGGTRVARCCTSTVKTTANCWSNSAG